MAKTSAFAFFALVVVLASGCSSNSNSDGQSGAWAQSGQGAAGQNQSGSAETDEAVSGETTFTSGVGGSEIAGISGVTGGANGVTGGAGSATSDGGGITGGSGEVTGGAGGVTGGAGGVTGGAGGATGGSGGEAEGSSAFGNIAVEELIGDGPYTATKTDFSGPNDNYTIYHPQELGPNGEKHPIVGWMSGGATNPDWYPMLPHLATHGFVVVASNTIPMPGGEIGLGQEIIAGIDWILEENDRSDSPFFGKLDPGKIASMGYSMGGLATMTIADDPRLTTTVHISGGTGSAAIERVQNLHAPAAFLCGASGVDIAGENCRLDFEAATTPVFYGVFTGDHLCILLPPCGNWISSVATGWLRWQLMNDQPLKSMFVGDQCSVCQDTNWTVQQKNLN